MLLGWCGLGNMILGMVLVLLLGSDGIAGGGPQGYWGSFLRVGGVVMLLGAWSLLWGSEGRCVVCL